MGLFTSCWMFHGILVGQQGYTKLIESKEYKESESVWKPYIMKLNESNWLFLIPESYHDFRRIDSMLDSNDRQRGYILIEEIKSILMKHFIDEGDAKHTEEEIKAIATKRLDSFFNPSKDSIAILNHMIQIATTEPVVPKWYYCEGDWNSYNGMTSCMDTVKHKYEIR